MNGSTDAFPRQLPLEFNVDAGLAADDLVVTAANHAAMRMIGQWPDWPSRVVVLAGPEGSGKTHLAAAWCSRSNAKILSPQHIPALSPGDRPAVLIENIDAAVLDESGLFHLINAVRATSGTLLLTARRPLASWHVRLADLSSRLAAATWVEILPPDDGLLSAVIIKLFADRQIEIALPVVEFLVHRMDRSLAEAARLVERIDAFSLERKCRITRALAADALAALAQEQDGAAMHRRPGEAE